MDLSGCFEPVRAVLRERAWPGVVEDASYGTPALKVRGKLLLRLSEPDTLVLPCDLEEKAMLKAAAPEVYFETAHYEKWPWILARLSAIDPVELGDRIERAWRLQATRAMVREFESRLG